MSKFQGNEHTPGFHVTITHDVLDLIIQDKRIELHTETCSVFATLGAIFLSGRRDLQHSALPDGFGLPRQELPRQREADVRFDVPRPQLSGVSR